MDLFRIGMQIGLKPDEVLDMSVDMFKACVKGYTDHIFDLQVLSVQQGYWSGYYSNAKHPKSVKVITESMTRKYKKDAEHDKLARPSVDVDVDRFLQTEKQFWERMNQEGGEPSG